MIGVWLLALGALGLIGVALLHIYKRLFHEGEETVYAELERSGYYESQGPGHDMPDVQERRPPAGSKDVL